MLFTSILVGVVTSTAFTVSMVSTSSLQMGVVEIEQPVPVVVTIQRPKVQASLDIQPKVKKSKVKGDCLKYKDIIDDYDWPVDIALNVCKEESSGNPNNVGDRHTAYVSCGLMQVRALPGRPSCEELKDPATNIAFAYELWKNEGWRPWSVCRTVVDCS